MCWPTSFLRFEVFATVCEVLWDFVLLVNSDVSKEHIVSVFKICQCKKSHCTSKYGYVIYQSRGIVAPKIWFDAFARAFLDFYCILISVIIIIFLSSSSYICHGVGPLVDLFWSHVSGSLFKSHHDSFCQLGNSVLLPWVTYFCLPLVYMHN